MSASTNGAANGSPVLNDREQARVHELVANMIYSRSQMFARLLDPRRDIDAECGYPTSIEPSQYRDLYQREPIAARVVQVLPKESWQAQPTVYETEDSDTPTAFENAWDALPKMLRGEDTSWFQDEKGSPIYEALRRVDILSGVGHYGVLLLGLDDGRQLDQPVEGFPEDGVPLGTDAEYNQPLFSQNSLTTNLAPAPNGKPLGIPQKKARKQRRLLFLRAFDESLAEITRYETNPANPRYGLPVAYSITFNDPSTEHTGIGLNTKQMMVHWSRVIHVADNLESSEIFGVPRMQQVYNRLLDIRKLLSGSGEMYWRGAFPGLSIESNPNLGGDVELDLEGIKDKIQSYMQGLQRYFTLTGMTAKSLAPQVVDPTPQIKVQIEAICIVLGIPMRVFMGSERGELASSQDDSTWNDRLQDRRQGYITPRLLVPFVDRLIRIGVLPEPKEGYSVEWPDLNALKPLEKATIAAQRTEAMAKYVGGGVDALMDPMDYLTRELGYTEEEAEEILKAALEHLEEAAPDAEAIVPGREPVMPEPEVPESPVKMREGEQLVNPKDGKTIAKAPPSKRPLVKNESDEWEASLAANDCGTGAGGFKPGNTCSKGGGGVSIEQLKQIGMVTEPAVKGYKKSPGDFTIAAQAAVYYARKNNEEQMLLVPGNSFGHKVFHIAKMSDDITAMGSAFIGGQEEQSIAIVKKTGEVFQAKATRKKPTKNEELEAEQQLALEDGQTNLPFVESTANSDCGTGSGGFKPGNTCAKGGGYAAGVAVAEKYKGEQMAHVQIKEYMEARGETFADYEAANNLLYQHNLASGGQTEKDIVAAWRDPNSAAGKGLRAAADLNEWQAENVGAAKGEFDLDAVMKRADDYEAKGTWESVGRRFQSGGEVAPTIDRYKTLIKAKAVGEPVFYRKGELDKDVISTTTDEKGARSGSSKFTPDRFWTYSEMKGMGYRLVSGRRGLVGVTSAQEREHIWIKDKLPTGNELETNAGDCGTGAGGFKPGNTCAKGGGGGVSQPEDVPPVTPQPTWEDGARKHYIEDAAAISSSEWTQTLVGRYKDAMAEHDARLSATHAAVAKIEAKEERLSKVHDKECKKLEKMIDGHLAAGLKAEITPEIAAQSEKVDAALDKYLKVRREKNEAALKEIKKGIKAAPGQEQIKTLSLARESIDTAVELGQKSTYLSPEQQETVTKTTKLLSGALSTKYAAVIEQTTVRRVPEAEKQRAYYKGLRHDGKDSSIFITRLSGEQTVAHELGHALETHGRAHSLAVGFLHSRVGSEAAKPMGEGYDKWEVGRDDEFGKAFGGSARYVGKHYLTNDTEVISMGLEKMVSDPVHFAKHDPEYFKFTLLLMDGSAL